MLPENLEVIYTKMFDSRVAISLVLNHDVNKYQVLVMNQVSKGVIIPQPTEMEYDIWEKDSAIQDIKRQYEAYKVAEKEVKKRNNNSIESLQLNMKDMAALGLKTIVRSN
jgi:hypothetical protein